MEDIIQSITSAEQTAAEIKEKALLKASEISSGAENESARILKENERECKLYRETLIAQAEKEAEENYKNEIEKKQAECKAYADGVIAKSESVANEIVRRVARGGC